MQPTLADLYDQEGHYDSGNLTFLALWFDRGLNVLKLSSFRYWARTQVSKIRNRAWVSVLGLFLITQIGSHYIDKLLDWAGPFLASSVTVQVWWLVFLIVIIVVLPTLLALSYKYAHHRANRLNELDDSLLRLLSGLISSSSFTEKDDAMIRLLDEFLYDATKMFTDVQRGSVLRLDPDDPSYLSIWKSRGMPVESVDQTRFYIGSESDKERGIAGRTYLDGNLRVVHLSKKNGSWVPDSLDYKKSIRRDRPPYHSFAVVPMNSSEGKPIGVLCFDSMTQHEFDSPKIKDLLLALGNRITAAVEIFNSYTV